jgi:8-oxo-dGTP diphosphatase
VVVARIPVVAGVIRNAQGEVLIAKRHDHLHQGGLWEFPGGKREAGETPVQALQRELHEELGIEVIAASPLIRIPHDYHDKAVLLDVWNVDEYRGEPHGREGQPLSWVAPDRLAQYDFPAANRPIVTAVRLPPYYAISGVFADRDDLIARLAACLARGVRLVQLRAKHLETSQYRVLAHDALTLCRAQDAKLMLNAEPSLAEALGADGVHLTSARLMACTARPLAGDKWVAASVHSAIELAHAARVGVDFAVLGPVLPTASHPGVPALGWSAFEALADQAPLPVYAVGGLTTGHLTQARACGAQGIAAIRAFWPHDAAEGL